MNRTCETCAYYSSRPSTETTGILWWKKTMNVTVVGCARFGPGITSLNNARGYWYGPAYVGPGARAHYAEGHCGAEGKYWEASQPPTLESVLKEMQDPNHEGPYSFTPTGVEVDHFGRVAEPVFTIERTEPVLKPMERMP